MEADEQALPKKDMIMVQRAKMVTGENLEDGRSGDTLFVFLHLEFW